MEMSSSFFRSKKGPCARGDQFNRNTEIQFQNATNPRFAFHLALLGDTTIALITLVMLQDSKV